MVDGYYAAVAAGPILENAAAVIHFYVWLDPENIRDSGDIAEGEYAKALLTRHWRTVARRLRRGVNYVPLFEPETADRRGSKWAAGFCEGVRDYREAWAPLKRDKVLGKWLKDLPRLILPEHDGKQHRAISVERRARILAALPAGIAAAHSFSRRWAEREGWVQGARGNPV